jgi:cytochrome c biogenesis factor
MIDPAIFDSLHHIYPLLVASAVAIAFVPLVISFSLKKDSEDNDFDESFYDIPLSLANALKFTRWGLKIASLLIMVAVILSLIYVYPKTSDGLFTWSFDIVVGTYGLIFLTFIVPVCVSIKVWLDRFRERRQTMHKYENAQELDYKGKY